jgi:hypothetical protein
MAYTKLIPRYSPGANVEEYSGGSGDKTYRLLIPAGPANKYRLAQLDDYAKMPRGKFPLHPPLRMNLSARVSSNAIPGTWGFGLWNDPFGLSLGFGGNPFRLPALPNAAWFFGASEENYLSFRDDKPAQGFLAQTFRSPRFHPLLILAGVILPFSRKLARRLMGKVIGEDALRLSSRPSLALENALASPSSTLDVTEWHGYQLNWREDRVSFEVDDALVFESRVSPHLPLGLVIWIDNQFAAFTPEGRIGFGILQNPEPAWLEVRDINIM